MCDGPADHHLHHLLPVCTEEGGTREHKGDMSKEAQNDQTQASGAVLTRIAPEVDKNSQESREFLSKQVARRCFDKDCSES